MALRPIDLQQVMVKSVDVTRETVQQQQLAAATQENLAAQLKTRHAQKTETVQDFEEVGAAAIHERGPRSGGDGQAFDDEAGEQEQDAPPLAPAQAALRGLPRPRVGRHVDVQA